MNLNAEQLKTIEDMAYLLISPALVCANLEADPIEFSEEFRNPGTPGRKAYMRGYIRQLVDTRKAVVKSAHNGSNPAQAELLKFIKDTDRRMAYEQIFSKIIINHG